jgi:hypothetical protein
MCYNMSMIDRPLEADAVARDLMVVTLAPPELMPDFIVHDGIEPHWRLGMAATAMFSKLDGEKLEKGHQEVFYMGVISQVLAKSKLYVPGGRKLVTLATGILDDYEITELLSAIGEGAETQAGGYSEDHVAFGIEVVRKAWDCSELPLPSSEPARTLVDRNADFLKATDIVRDY